MKRRRATVPLALLLAALTACGVSAEDTPREVEPPPGPQRVLAPSEPSASAPETAAQRIFLVRDDKLVPVVRWLRTTPPIDAHVRELIAGPTDAERDAGLSSALTGTNIIAGVRLANGVATVDVGDSLSDTGRTDQVLGFGQIVCTLTARPDVTGVVFHRSGERLGVPRADGSLAEGPFTAADYASLIAES